MRRHLAPRRINHANLLRDVENHRLLKDDIVPCTTSRITCKENTLVSPISKGRATREPEGLNIAYNHRNMKERPLSADLHRTNYIPRAEWHPINQVSRTTKQQWRARGSNQEVGSTITKAQVEVQRIKAHAGQDKPGVATSKMLGNRNGKQDTTRHRNAAKSRNRQPNRGHVTCAKGRGHKRRRDGATVDQIKARIKRRTKRTRKSPPYPTQVAMPCTTGRGHPTVQETAGRRQQRAGGRHG